MPDPSRAVPSRTPHSPHRAGGQGRRPLVFDTRELGRRPGTMRRVHAVVPAPADLRVELIGVPEGSDVDLELRFESVMEGVLVSGTALVRTHGECGRCLEPVDRDLEVSFQELYAYPDSTTSETTEDDEAARLDGDRLDLEPVLRDAVVLALPMTPLCRDDCAGLCPVCGERIGADGPHDHPISDPRWAALARFRHNGVDDRTDDGPASPVPDERE